MESRMWGHFCHKTSRHSVENPETENHVSFELKFNYGRYTGHARFQSHAVITIPTHHGRFLLSNINTKKDMTESSRTQPHKL